MDTAVRGARTHRAPRRRPPSSGLRLPSGLPWLVPALVLSAGIVYLCIGFNAWVSTFEWKGIGPLTTNVGLGNYAKALQDPLFWTALRNTLVFFTAVFVVQTVLGLIFAALLHSRIWLSNLYKVCVFVPVVIAPAIMAPVFRSMFADKGAFNEVLRTVGLGGLAQPWLAQPSTALWVLIVMQIWQTTGLSFILFYAAMSQIEDEILEAARLDGTSNLQLVWHIIVPSVRGTTSVLAMLTAINSLKLFDIPFLVTQGGPNYSTEFLGTYIYRQTVPFGNVGYAAALSILLLVLALAMGILLSARRRERQVVRSRND